MTLLKKKIHTDKTKYCTISQLQQILSKFSNGLLVVKLESAFIVLKYFTLAV